MLKEVPVSLDFSCEECGEFVKLTGHAKPILHFHLVTFNPPVCDVCKHEMKNITTVNGERIYGCMTWECTNRKLYTEDGTVKYGNPT